MQRFLFLLLPLLISDAEAARKKRSLSEDNDSVQQEPMGPVLEIPEDRKMGKRGEVFGPVYDAIDAEKNLDAVLGILSIIDDQQQSKYHDFFENEQILQIE